MGILKLTDRAAVVATIAECAAVGVASFIENHGFGKPTRYWVMHEGNIFPSKAIAGVAYRRQHGRHLPGLAGGVGHAATALHRLGFAIVDESGRLVPLAGLPSDELDEGESYPEGRGYFAAHLRRERNRLLVARRKAKAGSRPQCEVCGFDFLATYGARGEGFIECHHTRPVAEMKPHDRTRLIDLALVCANCHRMLHRSPQISVGDLRADLLRLGKEARRARAR